MRKVIATGILILSALGFGGCARQALLVPPTATHQPTATMAPIRTATATPKAPGETLQLGGESEREIIVTRDNHALPPGCNPREVARLIVRFFDVLNHGDQERLANFIFGSGPAGVSPSQWYSASEGVESQGGRHFVAYNLRDFLSYAVERHQQHERLRLIEVDVAGPSWHGGVDIAYVLTRQADDLLSGPGEHMAHGKGAVNCKEQKIFVWSMGMPIQKEQPCVTPAIELCPAPPPNSPSYAVIACSRG